MSRFDPRLLVTAIVVAVVSAFVSLGIALVVSSNESKKQRAVICRSAKANRQVLRDLVRVFDLGPYAERAEAVVNRPVPCDPTG